MTLEAFLSDSLPKCLQLTELVINKRVVELVTTLKTWQAKFKTFFFEGFDEKSSKHFVSKKVGEVFWIDSDFAARKFLAPARKPDFVRNVSHQRKVLWRHRWHSQLQHEVCGCPNRFLLLASFWIVFLFFSSIVCIVQVFCTWVFAANCICKILCISTSWVQSLYCPQTKQ